MARSGFAIGKQGDTKVVKSARNVQRDLIEVSAERPSLKPERMYTRIFPAKTLSVENINQYLRMLMSRDGEMSVNTNSDQLIFTDWVSTLNRVAEILKEVDKKVDPSIAKIVEASKKDRGAQRNEQTKKKLEKKEKTE